MRTAPLLCRFESVRPRHRLLQEHSLEWLAEAHTQSEITRTGGAVDAERFRTSMRRLIQKCACSPSQIASRGVEIADTTHTEWHRMRVYDVTRAPAGRPLGPRMEVFHASADAFFDRTFARDDRAPPCDLLHVTCTGYESPSGAQRVVAARGWGDRTRVLHAYQMGCYAAFPAVRTAAALVETAPQAGARRSVAIAHTELCSLHADPSQHSAEQIVVQSLFGDGMIRYEVSADDADRATPGLELLTSREEVLPDSDASMQWLSTEWGMRMVLSRDVPHRVRAALPDFVSALFRDAHVDFARARETAAFAVHPGGPRIIDAVRDVLELREDQVSTSREVLRDHGNMSSATVPCIWERITASPTIASGALVLSVAFGPGLTVSGALLRKR